MQRQYLNDKPNIKVPDRFIEDFLDSLSGFPPGSFVNIPIVTGNHTDSNGSVFNGFAVGSIGSAGMDS